MPQPRLLAVDAKDSKSREHSLLKEESTVGSGAGNGLVIDDHTVSRRHAVIRRRANRFELADLDSTNGTFVNGNRIIGPVTIQDRDQIRFGAARYQFLNGGAAADVASVPGAAKPRVRAKRMAVAIAALFLAGFGLTEYLVNGRGANRLREIFSNQSAPASNTKASDEASERTREAGSSEARSAPESLPSADADAAPPAEAHESAKAPLTGPDWLMRLNYYRELAKEDPVSEDEALSDGDRKHSRYLLENYIDLLKHGENLGGGMHTEDSDKPWYTPEGLAAAEHSDVFEGCSPLDPKGTIDGWMAGPFHRLSMLNPALTGAGFGSYRKDGCWTAGLDLRQGPRPREVARPIEFPPDGATLALEFAKGEWPDPLAACPDYAAPVGLPITLEIGAFADTQLGDHLLQRDGEQLEHCAYDASSYTNPDPDTQEQGRSVLRAFGTVVLIPREPLTPGARYTVTITAQGKEYTWSFAIASKEGSASESGSE